MRVQYHDPTAHHCHLILCRQLAHCWDCCLGLIFAWVIWPVQWTDAWPADLSQEARAQYLAAVAEAYVYYGDAQAAEVARNRLFNLNEDLPAAIADAQPFFIDNPQANSRVYISNLGQLAQALNIQSPDIIIDTPSDAAQPPLRHPLVRQRWAKCARLGELGADRVGGDCLGGWWLLCRWTTQSTPIWRQAKPIPWMTKRALTMNQAVLAMYVPARRQRQAAQQPLYAPMRGTTGGSLFQPCPTPRSTPLPKAKIMALMMMTATMTSIRVAHRFAPDYRSEDEIFDDPLDDPLMTSGVG